MAQTDWEWRLAIAMTLVATFTGGLYAINSLFTNPPTFMRSTPKRSLREMQQQKTPLWVAVCGTVFDVTQESVFNPHTGAYIDWIGHDVTFQLLQSSVAGDVAPEAMQNHYDKDISTDMVYSPKTSSTTPDENSPEYLRYLILKEWYVRFHSRYPVVAQLSDLFAGGQWDRLRSELTPTSKPSWHPQSSAGSRGKCPLGFGSGALKHSISKADANSKDVRWITFLGKKYDVTNSSLFQDQGQFAHLVGHDITHALATQSIEMKDLDVQATRPYTYDEQVMLETYRVAFAKEFNVLEDTEASTTSDDVHALLDSGDDTSIAKLKTILANGHAHVNEMCVRTSMTPLHKAVEKHQAELVRLLLAAGADAKAEASLYDDETPLQMAQRFHYDDIIQVLESHN